jgi:hypothetical protein
MTSTYKTITGVFGYSFGIYQGGRAVLQSNGRRFRTVIDCVRWSGNTGGAHEQITYLERAAGRAMLRKIRVAKIAELKGNWDHITVMDALSGY